MIHPTVKVCEEVNSKSPPINMMIQLIKSKQFTSKLCIIVVKICATLMSASNFCSTWLFEFSH